MLNYQSFCLIICTRSRGRTGTPKRNWFLRPARLPIPPSGLMVQINWRRKIREIYSELNLQCIFFEMECYIHLSGNK